MLPRQPAKLLRLHLSEQDRFEGAPLYEAIVSVCQKLEIAGITVFRGAEGYGASAEIHRRRVLAHDQPIVVTVVETPDNMDRLLAVIGNMVDTGMIAISNVEMIRVQNQDRRLNP